MQYCNTDECCLQSFIFWMSRILCMVRLRMHKLKLLFIKFKPNSRCSPFQILSRTSKGRSLICRMRHLSSPTVFSNINIFLLIVYNIRSCLPCLLKYFCPCSNWQVNIYTLTCIIFIFRSLSPGLEHIRKKQVHDSEAFLLTGGTEQYCGSKQCSAQTYRPEQFFPYQDLSSHTGSKADLCETAGASEQ